MTATVAVAATVAATIALAGLLWGERAGRPALRTAGKVTASTSFLVASVALRATGTPYGQWLLVGLTLSWLGDALLLSSAKRVFVAGIGAFLLAHVAYMVAFAARSLHWAFAGIAAAALLPAVVVVGRWLLPHTGRLKPAVIAYMVAITGMVAAAIGTVAAAMDVRLLGGALLFYASDLAVARNRFIAPGFANRAWGLPAYYAGQFLLVWSLF